MKVEEKNNNQNQEITKNEPDIGGVQKEKGGEQEKKNPKDQNKITEEKKLKEQEEKILRTLAEMENQRRRFEKERDDAFEFGGFSFAKESLALIDNLERAKKTFLDNKNFQENKDFSKMFEVFEILEKDLIAIFKRNNVEQINCLNEKFDPNFHQAMLEVDDTSKEPGTIVQEIQKGYKMKDRLLRPSLVGVTRFETQKLEKSSENQEKNEAKK